MSVELNRYLGDGVYAQYEPCNASITLRTGSHKAHEADNTIFLEPEVLAALDGYRKNIAEVELVAEREYLRDMQEKKQS